MNYWNGRERRAEQARIHTDEMQSIYFVQIQDSVVNTIIYGGPDRDPVQAQYTELPLVLVDDTDSVTAIGKYRNGRTAVLNFASYKNPGGKFYEGSSAQEESLCHASFLYNVLARHECYYAWNRNNLNRALYTDRAMYTPSVIFEINPITKVYCDVITCAAPNLTAAKKYQRVTDAENEQALSSRIQFIRMVAEGNQVNTLIAGAFGCGVFGQDPARVAEIFKSEFARSSVKTIVYAIPGGKNLYEFKRAFEG